MTKPRELSINIPFDGFYNSLYSGELDNIEEQECEHFENEKELEFAPELRITSKEYWEILYRHSSYSKMHDASAEKYTSAFDDVASEAIGIPLKLRYETMVSPREYNFTTDRIFCFIRASVVRRLFAMSRRDKHKQLAETIKDRHTSYDGFHSFYTNDISRWLDRPVTDWDHNELGTLLIACYILGGRSEDWRMDVYYRVTDMDGLYNEWSEGVDWTKVDADVAELRAEK